MKKTNNEPNQQDSPFLSRKPQKKTNNEPNQQDSPFLARKPQKDTPQQAVFTPTETSSSVNQNKGSDTNICAPESTSTVILTRNNDAGSNLTPEQLTELLANGERTNSSKVTSAAHQLDDVILNNILSLNKSGKVKVSNVNIDSDGTMNKGDAHRISDKDLQSLLAKSKTTSSKTSVKQSSMSKKIRMIHYMVYPIVMIILALGHFLPKLIT